jgi:FkbM family methyltransferase
MIARLEISAMDELYVRVKGGGEICVPASPSITTYVLIEQEDWFEAEIAFVRRLLRPGMRAIDVGANYGTYTLAMAKAVGASGRVWAYEPASATARYLRNTIGRNGLAQVEMCQAALSARRGIGRLHLDTQVELNRLTADGNGEEVSLTTLDSEHLSRSWEPVDFIKIDAEGSELDIIRGGETFFAEQSPLVMFERRAADRENEGVQSAFRTRGYALFKLIGPDEYLVPVGLDERFDAFDLNLFACKPDRAEILSAAGLLTTACAKARDAAPGSGLALWRRQNFAGAFADAKRASKPAYQRALDAYAVWRDPAWQLSERCGALNSAAEILRRLTADTRNLAVLSTGARVAHEAGMRVQAIDCLNRMRDLMRQRPPQLNEPFWPAAARYDAIRPGAADRGIWFLAATLEAYEQRRAFSSQFAAPETLAGLDWLAGTPYASPAMERRRQLIAISTGRQRQRQASPLLNKTTAEHLNPQLWGGRGATAGTAAGGEGERPIR